MGASFQMLFLKIFSFRNFQGFVVYCLIIKVLLLVCCCFLSSATTFIGYHVCHTLSRTFSFFFRSCEACLYTSLSGDSFDIISHRCTVCQHFFRFLSSLSQTVCQSLPATRFILPPGGLNCQWFSYFFILWYQGQKVVRFMLAWKSMTLGP